MHQLPQYSVAKHMRISREINQRATSTGVSGPPKETIIPKKDCFQRWITQKKVDG